MTETLVSPETLLSIQPSEYRPWWDFASKADLDKARKAKTTAQKAAALGIDWTVAGEPVFTKVGNRYIEVPGKKAIVRTDTGNPLSIMGGRYHLLQNDVIVEMADAMSKEGVEFIGGGEFGGGRVVWAQGLLPRSLHVVGDESPIEPYLLVFTSHDGSRPFGAVLTALRVWCQNTFNAAIRNAKTRFSIRHTPNAMSRIAEAQRVLGLSYASLEVYERAANSLAEVPMTLDEVYAYTEALLPTPPVKDETKNRVLRVEEDRQIIVNLFARSEAMGDMPKTAYRALQAVTEWSDHHREYRASAGNSVEDNKALSLFDGQASRLKERALALLIN